MFKLFNPLWLIENLLTLHWVGAAISVGGSLLGSALSSDAAGDAAGAQTAASAAAIKYLQDQADQTRTDTAPYRDIGSAATGRLSYLLGLTPETSMTYADPLAQYQNATDQGAKGGRDFLYQAAKERGQLGAYYKLLADGSLDASTGTSKADKLRSMAAMQGQINAAQPGTSTTLDKSDGQYGSLLNKFTQNDLNNDVVYQNGLQFGLDNGNKALENRARAMGGYDSGSILKALAKYGNDYGTTKAEGAYNRFNTDKSNTYNMLSGQQTTGLNAVNTTVNANNGIAQAIAGGMTDQGNARSAGIIGQNNALQGALGSITDAGIGLYDKYGNKTSSGGGTSIPIVF